MIITIQGRLPGLNDVINANRTNKYLAAKIKKDTEQLISVYIKNQCKVKYERIKVSFNWYEPNMRRDYDNISSATKFLLDALVKCQVIKNDGWKNIAPDLHHKFFLDKDNPRIEIIIEEA